MGYIRTTLCTHLTLGMCPCTPNVTHDFGSSSSTKKRKICKKTHVSARKKKRSDGDQDEAQENSFWKIKKVLKESDVGEMARLMLSKDMAENFIMPMLCVDSYEIYQGVDVKIWDVDTKSMHSLVFKRWASGSYVFIGNWNKDFVSRRGLNSGDEIGLQWNSFNNAFNFSILQVNYMG